ncbi:hypothetical protein CMI37_13310 [Candidatus Pacearchaeota archaeon]|nr:hypothetical protein [Candidatus Pacearchaeota archaeon]|tara:strand:- start:5089 stop:5319 length:231 start_codon:yes stop_codon:yes gene_type:complete
MVSSVLILLFLVTAIGTLAIVILSWMLLRIARALLQVDIEILNITKDIDVTGTEMNHKLEALERLPIPRAYREVKK